MRLHFLLQLRNDFPQMNIYSSYDISYNHNHNHNHKMERYCGQTDWSNMQYTHTSMPAINKFSPQVNISWPPFFYSSFSFYLFCSRFTFLNPHSLILSRSFSVPSSPACTHSHFYSISIFQYVGDIIADCIICKFLYFIGSTKIHLPKPMKQ